MRYACFYCGHRGNDVTHHYEHPYPQWMGGTSTVDACCMCNWQKGGKTRHQYARWLLENPAELQPGVPYWDSDRRPFVRRTLGIRV